MVKGQTCFGVVVFFRCNCHILQLPVEISRTLNISGFVYKHKKWCSVCHYLYTFRRPILMAKHAERSSKEDRHIFILTKLSNVSSWFATVIFLLIHFYTLFLILKHLYLKAEGFSFSEYFWINTLPLKLHIPVALQSPCTHRRGSVTKAPSLSINGRGSLALGQETFSAYSSL